MALRVVLYTTSRTFGGAEHVLVQQAIGLRERGFEIRVASESSDVPELQAACQSAGLSVTSLVRKDHLAFEVGLYRWLREVAPVVFHLHRGWPSPGASAIAAATLARVPVVAVTEHLWAEPSSRSRRLNRMVDRWVDVHIAVSEDVARHLINDLGLGRRRVRVIHNGVDVEEIARRAAAAREETVTRPYTALTVARLAPQKGIGAIIAAATILTDVRFLIAGDGPDRSGLEDQARASGVSDRVVFLGQRSDVPELLAMSDVFVLPSFFEGLPVSVLEAMVARTPIVATNVDGTREVLSDGETALLIRPGDPVELARAISGMRDDADMRRRLVRAASEHVSARFSAEASLDAVAALYHELIADRRS